MWDAVERCRDAVGGLADAALPGARGAVELAALLAEVDRAVLRELAGGRPSGEPPPACRAGCAACCTLNVATLAVEGAVAAAFLRERLGAAPAAALGARLAAFHDRVRWLEDGERIARRETCPLLDGGGRCLVHPVRPLACRSVSSLDAGECRRAMSAGAEDEEEGRLVRMDLLQRALYAAALGALGEAIARRGLDARCRDVSGMTGIFLGDASLGPAFLAGRRLPIE